jgi:hypothetical protein
MPGATRRMAGLGAALLLACAGAPPEPTGARPDLLRWAATGDACPPPALLAGEYRRAIVEHDVPGVAAFVGEEALQCDPGAFVPAEAVRRALRDPKSFLSAALFDGARLRSADFRGAGGARRESQAELLADEALTVSVTEVAATTRMDRAARVIYRVPGTAWLDLGFTCRAGRWILADWGGLECRVGPPDGAPLPKTP